uniref:ATP synthase F0 subunit 6 n=1 Tax=Macrogyrodactylus karibae TaxID=696689 RepID=A0A2Z4GPK0_9PLAT|nr:ATP synthase F0 subunit 6 [Macrogyrodactylus karibae]
MIFNSYFSCFNKLLSSLVNNLVISLKLIGLILFIFLVLRIPGNFEVFYFVVFLFTVLFPYFASLFISRLVNSSDDFFASFTPVGAPIGIAPFVCMAEGISYIVRPFVLMLRPFLNLSIGAFGAAAVGTSISSGFSLGLLLLFLLLFFYELFVCIVHWFIVTNILIFSVDH